MGAPFAMSVSVTTNRSSTVRPPPPHSTGQVMPSQPRHPSPGELAGVPVDPHVVVLAVLGDRLVGDLLASARSA